jgi:hypothetical protein
VFFNSRVDSLSFGTLTAHVEGQHDPIATQQGSYGIRRLCAFKKPVDDPVLIYGECCGLLEGVVPPQVLDVTTVARTASVCGNNGIKWALAATHSA